MSVLTTNVSRPNFASAPEWTTGAQIKDCPPWLPMDAADPRHACASSTLQGRLTSRGAIHALPQPGVRDG
eukprot:3920456-Amphidinium_carterae.2